MEARFWEEMYAGRDQVFSGAPNGVLVTEVTGMPAGRALDVGCGEGGDAIWLAEQGWQVTAIDVSPTALRRAAAADHTGRVDWACADLTRTSPRAGAFDLVNAQYFHPARQLGEAPVRGLLDAVAPGGTLLVVGHDMADLTPHDTHGLEPGDYYQPTDVAAFLDEGWKILVNEIRPRTVAPPPGTHHTHDIVLRARRLP
jgi:SAM-dependent methyltransferase